ncbi:MAG: hypothetical protein U5O16_23910 [Rhodococcus sp. (in: high G+C Gram-positive bacteria)]|uniref:hypothetical protein n=1 Tax=Rhodococcus sp. TaxID=1831 RepID=UPI002AD88DB8|nr:hypothetical protein [Rhodococcus sp. (in: high G+C Gram-positive bacteria)]
MDIALGCATSVDLSTSEPVGSIEGKASTVAQPLPTPMGIEPPPGRDGELSRFESWGGRTWLDSSR